MHHCVCTTCTAAELLDHSKTDRHAWNKVQQQVEMMGEYSCLQRQDLQNPYVEWHAYSVRDIHGDIAAFNGQVQVSRSEVKIALEGTIWLNVHASVIAKS